MLLQSRTRASPVTNLGAQTARIIAALWPERCKAHRLGEWTDGTHIVREIQLRNSPLHFVPSVDAIAIIKFDQRMTFDLIRTRIA
jgi:hypothetical protein